MLGEVLKQIFWVKLLLLKTGVIFLLFKFNVGIFLSRKIVCLQSFLLIWYV